MVTAITAVTTAYLERDLSILLVCIILSNVQTCRQVKVSARDETYLSGVGGTESCSPGAYQGKDSQGTTRISVTNVEKLKT